MSPSPSLRLRTGILLVAGGLVASVPCAAQDPLARGERLVEEQDYAGARRAVEPYARSHPADARAAYLLGRAFYGERKLDEAVEWLGRAVSLDGRRAEHHLYLGNAYGMQAVDANVIRRAVLARRARLSFERAVELEPGSVDARLGLLRFHLLAPAVLGGDIRKAREQAGAIRARNPYRGVFAALLIHRHEGNDGAVEAEYVSAVRQFPDSTAFYYPLANIYIAQQRYGEARELFHRLLGRRPGEMAAHYQIGRIGALAGQHLDEAEASLRRYLGHTPTGGEPPAAAAHWRLGQLAEHRGDVARARAAYRTSLSLQPDYEESRKALVRLGG